MSADKLSLGLMFFGIMCVTGLVAQCSHNTNQCKMEAIKAGAVKAETISAICRS